VWSNLWLRRRRRRRRKKKPARVLEFPRITLLKQFGKSE
jgi:hypothetical protein